MIYTLLNIIDSEIISKIFACKATNKKSGTIIINIVYLLTKSFHTIEEE